jgi:hypothetical protein
MVRAAPPKTNPALPTAKPPDNFHFIYHDKNRYKCYVGEYLTVHGFIEECIEDFSDMSPGEIEEDMDHYLYLTTVQRGRRIQLKQTKLLRSVVSSGTTVTIRNKRNHNKGELLQSIPP